ncbi:DUF3658 domain-containing protein [Enterobacter ludwigii]|uniref:DUF3658 domain-containing protein n=1 Tax=Enterobacter ludwigii TaxID=299767 RepID=UPI003F7138D8
MAERQTATPAIRSQLANEWVQQRDHGSELRIIENNRLTECSFGYFATRLLSIVGEQPTRPTHAIGQAMSETGMTDMFCKWRYITLIQRGELTLISGNLHDGSDSAIIGKPRGSRTATHRAIDIAPLPAGCYRLIPIKQTTLCASYPPF